MTHVPFQVEARIPSGRVVLPDPWSCMLDGLLAAVMLKDRLGANYGYSAGVAELQPDDLPLEAWSHGDEWWFAATAPIYADEPDVDTDWLVGRQDTYNARLYCPDLPKSIQTQGGRYRNTRTPVPVTLTERLVWRGIGDIDAVMDLLSHVDSVGARRGAGFGVVTGWAVERLPSDAGIWRDAHPGPTRPLPAAYATEQGFTTEAIPCPLTPPYHATKEPRHTQVAARW